jgi:hypothetical protein
MRGRHLMKRITTTPSVRRVDSSLDATLNPLELSSKEIVSWSTAFPRPGSAVPRRTLMWRTDATIGTVLGAAGRMRTRREPVAREAV